MMRDLLVKCDSISSHHHFMPFISGRETMRARLASLRGARAARLSRLSEKVRKRLERAFARCGLDADRFVTFIPWQNSPEFHGWLCRGFSGFNTAIQGVQCGIPIVTTEGRFMCGRFASGILNRMGLQELVARSEQEYIERAVQLAKDTGYRGGVRDRIEKSHPILFEDVTAISAFGKFSD